MRLLEKRTLLHRQKLNILAQCRPKNSGTQCVLCLYAQPLPTLGTAAVLRHAGERAPKAAARAKICISPLASFRGGLGGIFLPSRGKRRSCWFSQPSRRAPLLHRSFANADVFCGEQPIGLFVLLLLSRYSPRSPAPILGRRRFCERRRGDSEEELSVRTD